MFERVSRRVTENIVPFGVNTGDGVVGTPNDTRGSTSSFNSDEFDESSTLLQVMLGPGTPVAVHIYIAVIPSFTVISVSSGGAVISGGTIKRRGLIRHNTKTYSSYISQSVRLMQWYSQQQ